MNHAATDRTEPPPTADRFAYLDGPMRNGLIAQEADVFQPLRVRARDGHELRAFASGSAEHPAVVLVNPLGISCLFMAPLAHRLSRRFRVLTWESRGLPDTLAPVPDSLQLQGNDLEDLLREAGHGGRCHAVVGYCSGAYVAALAASEPGIAARRLCLVSPSFDLGPDRPRTDYQNTVMPLWPRVAREGHRMAALVRVLLGQAAPVVGDALEAELHCINRMPFRSDADLLRYATLLTQTTQIDVRALLPRISLPALLLHSERDDIVHTETARTVASLLPRCELFMETQEGHFAIYRSQALHDRIDAFLREPAAVQPPSLPP